MTSVRIVGSAALVPEGASPRWTRYQSFHTKPGARPNLPMVRRIDDWSPAQYLGDKGWKFMNRSTQLLLSSLVLSLRGTSFLDPERSHFDAGVYVGSALGNKQTILDYDLLSRTEGPHTVSAKLGPVVLANYPASSLAQRTRFRGPNLTFSAGSCSGAAALETALMHMNNGLVSKAIVASVEVVDEVQHKFLLAEGFEDKLVVESSCVFLLDGHLDESSVGVHVLNVRSSTLDVTETIIIECLAECGLRVPDLDVIIMPNGYSETISSMHEAYRLFASYAKPMYVLGAPGIDFYGGQVLISVHYLSNLLANGLACILSMDHRGLFSCAIVQIRG